MDTIAYKLAHLYLTTKFRKEFVDQATELKENESSGDELEMIWDVLDAMSDIRSSF